MKTNHRRGFVDGGSFRDRSCQTVASAAFDARGTDDTPTESGVGAYIGNDFTNGHRGHAKAVHGAKAHVRHAVRRFNKRLTRRELDRWEKDHDRD